MTSSFVLLLLACMLPSAHNTSGGKLVGSYRILEACTLSLRQWQFYVWYYLFLLERWIFIGNFSEERTYSCKNSSCLNKPKTKEKCSVQNINSSIRSSFNCFLHFKDGRVALLNSVCGKTVSAASYMQITTPRRRSVNILPEAFWCSAATKPLQDKYVGSISFIAGS